MSPDAWACEYLGLWPDALEDTALVDAWTAAAVAPADARAWTPASCSPSNWTRTVKRP